ncbi:MAG TPA: mycothiol synthase [Acidimicrobiales bacterium]|nr:mycothiol synthase [Acidimicrobiales bacterium]
MPVADPVALTVLALPDLDAADRTALVELVAAVEQSGDGHPPLPEPQLRAVTGNGEGDAVARVVLARSGGRLVAAAILSPAHDGSTVVHTMGPVSSGPDGDAIRTSLLELAVAEAPARAPIHLWAMEASPVDDARSAALGFAPERDLLQMRVPLPLPDDVIAATRPLVTRPFVRGQDEETWVAANNRAFAGHPEQGGWTVGQLRERMQAEWVELDGFLLADDPEGAGLVGSCWTKIHRDRTPVLGEIYVISVDPRHHGQGWGRSLTVAGLQWIASRGIAVGMLYTDADNEAAVALYRSLGFDVDHVDRSYRRPAR